MPYTVCNWGCAILDLLEVGLPGVCFGEGVVGHRSQAAFVVIGFPDLKLIH